MNVSGTRIRARYLQGEDGSRSFVGFWDSSLREPCAWLKAEDGKTRCLPQPEQAASAGVFFLDARCTEIAFYTTLSCQGEAKYGRETVVTCDRVSYNVYTLTPAEGATIHRKYEGQCTVETPQTSYRFYRGSKISASEFVAAELKTE